MSRTLNRLTAQTIKSAKPGKYADGGGLWINKRPDGGAQWVLRVTVHGRRREMGLGGFPDVTLAEAREAASHWRTFARRGIDPVKERQRQRREAERNLHQLRDVALDAFESRKAELRGDGKAGRWFSPLEVHILPKLGRVPVAEIDQIDIRDTLAPIWHEKAVTARKAMNRLAICMRHAAALGLDVDLQATEKAKALLGKQRHSAKQIPSMPWLEVPEFYQSLSGGSIVELALRMLILTGMRSKAVRFMSIDQVNGDVWTIPSGLMKGREGATQAFRVPLSTEASAVLAEALPMARDGYLFPGVRKGVISDMTMSTLMSRRGVEARPHGFRASLRNWMAEATSAPRDVAETCIGHVTGSAVERAYRTTDFLEKRRVLMEKWGKHVSTVRGDTVVHLS